MAELFGLLDTLGIEPIGALDIDFTDMVQYREVGQFISDKHSVPPPAQADPEAPSIIVVPQPVNTEKLDLNPISHSEALKVQLRDSVRYCFVDSPDDEAFVTIVDSESNPDLGFLNKDTVVARALLGAAIGQERVANLPMGKRIIRILEVLKPSLLRKTRTANGALRRARGTFRCLLFPQ